MDNIKPSGISIIIPIYNASLFLEKCLKSIINQTYKDLEIICIESCSTDNSLEILKEIAKTDNRIKVIEETKNNGAGYNRNLGIKLATKEYIGFIDSDDYIDPDFYERLYDAGKIYNADVTMTETQIINQPENKIMLIRDYNFRCEYCLDKKFEAIKEGVCWDKIYRTEFLKQNEDIRFPEGVLHEDNLFMLKVLNNCNKLIIVPGSYYYWVRNPFSVCFRPDYKEKRIQDAYTVFELAVEYLRKNKISKETSFVIIKFMLDHFGSIALNNPEYKDKITGMIKTVDPQIDIVVN